MIQSMPYLYRRAMDKKMCNNEIYITVISQLCNTDTYWIAGVLKNKYFYLFEKVPGILRGYIF